MKKYKTRELKKGEYFRTAGKEGISPEIWFWEGEYQDPDKKYGYIIYSSVDNHRKVIYPDSYIVPLEPLEDF